MSKIIRGINASRSLFDKLLRRSHLRARPLRIQLEVNDLCNLSCLMCARQSDAFPKNRGEMPMEVINRLVPWFKFASYVGLAGNGEPFLHRKILEILKKIISAGSVPSVVTNATLLDEKCIEDLLNLGPLIIVASIDSARKETFEFIRQGADYDLVIGNLQRLKQLKKKTGNPYPIVNLITCLMKQNINELSEIVELAHWLGAPLVLVQNLLPYNDWARENIISDKAVIEPAINRAKKTAERLNIRFEYLPAGEPLALREKDFAKFHNGYYCEFIWQQLHVEIDGNVRFCCFWTEGTNGNLLYKSPQELWNSTGFAALRRELRSGIMPKDCQNCHMLTLPDARKLISATLWELKEIWRR